MSLYWKRTLPADYSDDESSAEVTVLRQHWKFLLKVFQKPFLDQDDIHCVVSHFQHAVGLLVDEVSNEKRPGPVLLYFVAESLLDTFFIWSLSCPEYASDLKYYQLRCYESLLCRSRHELLFHKQIFKPLLNLLRSCESTSTSLEFIEKHMIVVLNQICVSITKCPELLEFCFDISAQHGPSRFIIFSLLIPFVHRDGVSGQQARDALLLIMQLSHRNQSIALYIVEQTNFCPVLATGLSALYSDLPHRLETNSDDWFQLTKREWSENSSIVQFMNSLQFCDDVIQISHPSIGRHLLQYIYHGFLIPVLGPSIYQNNTDEVIAATAYLDLFLRSIHQAALLKVFLRFILCAKIDEINLLETLIERIHLSNKLGLISLELFYTLISLNCEDVMFRLIFIYLIPCRHVMSSQRRYINEMDIYGKNAECFLSLKPTFIEHEQTDKWSNPLERYSCTFAAYLQDAHRNIVQCRRACLCWSAPYDGETPSPESILNEFDVISMSSSADESSMAILPSLSLPVNVNESKDSGIHEEILDVNTKSNENNDTFQLPSWLVNNEPVPDELLAKYSLNKSVTENQCEEEFNDEQRHAYSFYSFSFIDWSENKDEDIWSTHSSLIPDVQIQTEIGTCVETIHDCLDQFRQMNDNTDERDEILQISQLIDELIEAIDDDVVLDLEKLNEFWQKRSSLDDFLHLLDQLIDSKRLKISLKKSEQISNQLISVLNEIETFRTVGSTMNKQESNISNPTVSTLTSMEMSFFQCSELSHSTIASNICHFASASTGKSTDIGPFLRAIFVKLENMLQNSFTVNLLLTGVIARLAQYNQPLLRSFLLNQNLVLQTDVKSLFQILLNLKLKLETISQTFNDFPQLIRVAHENLYQREKPERPIEETNKRNQSRSKSVGSGRERTSKRNGFWNFFRARNRTVEREETKSDDFELSQITMINDDAIRFVPSRRKSSNNEWNDPKTRHLAHCALIYNEFIKELAALTLEHGVQQFADDQMFDDPKLISLMFAL